MPTIAKIAVQKHNKERYSIFIESAKGEEYAFSVDESTLIRYGLKKGMELSDLPLADIMFQEDVQKAYNHAVHYLSHRMRSEKEVREYLKKKEIADTVMDAAINKLYEFRFLDDREFALAYTRTQMNTTDKGPNTIRRELKEKGIEGEMSEEALAEFKKELQIEKAAKLGNKLAAKNMKDSTRVLKQKIELHLQRKGYPFNIIAIARKEIKIGKQEDEMSALTIQGEKLKRKYHKLEGFLLRQKIKQGLYQKGFPLDLIDRYIDEMEDGWK
ncbi:recombination regulator RecX [Bacillus massilinigeriensis]|uniref:recombination regulator RecX n=1 Tax=Bacillus mediterraneensis TaxID=1805474 RepID=UPI0008F8A617|nr:recombination regulator RecX [Bacillus mediterraneensis]